MNKTTQKNIELSVPIGGLISHLHNIRSKIVAAGGAVSLLDLYLRIIAQLEPKVRDILYPW